MTRAAVFPGHSDLTPSVEFSLDNRPAEHSPQQRLPLCPKFAAFAKETDAFYDGLPSQADIEQIRDVYAKMSAHFARPLPPDIQTFDLCGEQTGDEFGGLPPVAVRIYVPTVDGVAQCDLSTSEVRHRQTCIVYFHGGGFSLGGLETHHSIVADLCAATGLVCVSADYRLAPEYRCPAALEDACSLVDWLSAKMKTPQVVRSMDAQGVFVHDGMHAMTQPRQIILAGDSSGGTLAAGVAIRSANLGIGQSASVTEAAKSAIIGQLLVYPVLGVDFATQSYQDNADAAMLTRPLMRDIWETYLGHSIADVTPDSLPMGAVPNVCHLSSQSIASSLAPAAILTAGHDPVRDDGAVYAAKLRAAGIPVAYRCDGDLGHGHVRARNRIQSAANAFKWICAAARHLADAQGP